MKFRNFWVQYKVNGESFDCKMPDDDFVIGRAPDCDLSIQADVLSRNHLRFYLDGQDVYVQDLGSTNGSYMNKEKLDSNKAYKYIPGKIIYIHGDDSVSFSVTPLFKKTEGELDLEVKEFDLVRQKEKLERKNSHLKKELKKENYIRVAGESVDSIYENLKYVAKSARFNKEKAITEAEDKAKEILQEAIDEADQLKAKIREEILEIEAKTKKEVKKILSQAKNSARNKLAKAQEKAESVKREAIDYKETLTKEADETKQQVLVEALARKSEIISEAEQKREEIIVEANTKNKALKEENKDLVEKITIFNAEKMQIESQLADLNTEHQENTQRVEQTRLESRDEISNLNALKLKVLDLENRNNEAKRVLNSEIPGLETKIEELREAALIIHARAEEEKAETQRLSQEIAQKTLELDKFEKKTDKAESRIDELNDKITEGERNLFKLNQIKKERIEEVDREINLRRDAQQENEEIAISKIEKRRKRAEKEIEVNIAKAKERALEILNEAKLEKENVDRLVEERRQQVESEVLEQLSEARNETTELKLRAKKEIESKREEVKVQVAEEKDRLLSTAITKSSDLIDQANLEATKILAEAKVKADLDMSDLQKEIEVRKNETDKEIHDLRSNVVQKLEEQKKQFERDEQQRTQVRVMRLKKELNDVLRARIVPFLKDKEQLDKVGTIIGKSVNAIMLDEIDDDFIKNENYSDIDPSLQQAQNRKFFYISGFAATMVIAFLVLMPTFKKAAKDSSRNIASEMEKDTKQKIEKVKKEGSLAKAFNPPKTDIFYPNYTDRVLYTKDYVKIELNPNYREQWILELQDYFIDELRLNENNLVPFIAQEANLIRELSDEMKRINGNFADKGIVRMREIESVFTKKLKKQIKKSSDFKKIMKFKEEFFLENKVRFN